VEYEVSYVLFRECVCQHYLPSVITRGIMIKDVCSDIILYIALRCNLTKVSLLLIFK